MSLRFACPACGRQLTVPDSAAGRKVRCAFCQAAASAPAAPPADDSLSRDLSGLLDGGLLEEVPLAEDRTPPPARVPPPPLPPPSGDAYRGQSAYTLPAAAAAQPGQIGSLGRFFTDCLSSAVYGIQNLPTCLTFVFIASLITVGLALPVVLLAWAQAGPAGFILMAIVLLVACMVMTGYFLQFLLNVANSSIANDQWPPALPEFNFGELFLMGLKGVGIWFVYVAPILTLPLLPLGLLALAQTGDGRAFNFVWAFRAAARRPGRLALLWLFLIILTALGCAVVIILAMQMPSLYALLPGDGGIGKILLAAPIGFVCSLLVGSLTVALQCNVFRCIGFLGKHDAEAIRSLPRENNVGAAVGYVALGLILNILVTAVLAGPLRDSVIWFARSLRSGEMKQSEKAYACRGNLDKIAVAISNYNRWRFEKTGENKYPPDLESLVENGFLSTASLVCPATGHKAPTWDPRSRRLVGAIDYIYLGFDDHDPTETIVAHDRIENHSRLKTPLVNVLHNDLHNASMTPAELSDRLEKDRQNRERHLANHGDPNPPMAKCNKHMRAIADAIAAYRKESGGPNPPGFAALCAKGLSTEDLVCPCIGTRPPVFDRASGTLTGKCDYVYLGGDSNWLSRTLLVYEEASHHGKTLANVVTMDLSVDYATTAGLATSIDAARRLKSQAAEIASRSPTPDSPATPNLTPGQPTGSCAKNMQAIADAIAAYRRESGGANPPGFAALCVRGLPPDCLACPGLGSRPPVLDRATGTLTGQVDYIYLGGEANWPARTLLVYEETSHHGGNVANVVYMGLSVDQITPPTLVLAVDDARRLRGSAAITTVPPMPAPSPSPAPVQPVPERPEPEIRDELPLAAWSVNPEPNAGVFAALIKPTLSLSYPMSGEREVAVPGRPSKFLLTINKAGGWETWDLLVGYKVLGGPAKLEMEDLAFSPDGVLIGGTRKGTSSDPATAEVWSLKTQQRVAQVEAASRSSSPKVVGFPGGGRVLVFHPRAEGVARSSTAIVNMATGLQVGDFPMGWADSLRLTPGGSHAIIHTGSRLQFFSTETGRPSGSVPLTAWQRDGQKSFWSSFAGLAFSPDGREFALLYAEEGWARLVSCDMASGIPNGEFLFRDKARTSRGTVEYLPDASGWLIFGDTVVSKAAKGAIYAFPKPDPVLFSRMATPERLLQVTKPGNRLVFQTVEIPKTATRPAGG